MNEAYPQDEFPWNFYFNGELMPKWGACWGMARLIDFLQPNRNTSQDIGHRDIYIIDCQIDHVGTIESADPEVFIYAIQEVLCVFLNQRDAILNALNGQRHEVYSGLVGAALRMRELVVEQQRAFWTSGHESDRMELVEAIRRSQLPCNSPEFECPPHVQRVHKELKRLRKDQVRRLHQLAQSGNFDKELRQKLHEIHAA